MVPLRDRTENTWKKDFRHSLFLPFLSQMSLRLWRCTLALSFWCGDWRRFAIVCCAFLPIVLIRRDSIESGQLALLIDFVFF